VIYVFHGVTAEADYAAYSASFEATMSSFARLTDVAKINVKPKRIIVKTILKAGTLNDAFISFGVKQEKLAELALLNNMELTDKVSVGKKVKIIGE
jgi:predicted Zn-dependent protease